jgi:hypothetical protein
LLRLYEEERDREESPTAFFARVDPRRVTALLGPLLAAPPAAAESADIGSESGFLVQTGEGECAA